ncbi:MAG: aldo/keto reductase [Oscillospiraceae bacterium]|nr:aldo/keto reductase [Oscillospiraceae bacterium]
MHYKDFQGKQFSFLGMGNMRLPRSAGSGEDFRNAVIDYEKAAEIIDYGMANGVNYYDTSHIYGGSEEFLGKALSKYPRDSYYLCTKYNTMGGPDFEGNFQGQLERLNTDYIDIYMIQAVLNDQSAENYLKSGCMEFIEKQKEAGRIRHVGFSAHAPASTLEWFVKAYPWEIAMIQLNYFDWAFAGADEQYKVLTDNGIPVVAMEPARGGRLANLSDEATSMLKALRPDWSPASWAYRWHMGLSNMLVVLSGMSALEQIVDNVNTFETLSPLTDEENTLLDQVREQLKSEIVVPCTECGYCLEDCPAQIDIPEVMKVYNDLRILSWAMSGQAIAKLRDAEKTPADCTACKTCIERCTQAINIPEIMEELTGRLSSGGRR